MLAMGEEDVRSMSAALWRAYAQVSPGGRVGCAGSGGCRERRLQKGVQLMLTQTRFSQASSVWVGFGV